MSSQPNKSVGKLRRFVGDLRQLASVRQIILDEGQERGVRALAFSTGGGLDFWVFCDRSFDIGPLWWKGTPIAWQSPNGFASPTLHHAEHDRGYGFERLFGGFLVTCGLDHIRQPQPEQGLPLHGRFPFSPGRLLSYGENWELPTPVLFCEGEITQARLHGERLRLKRRIEAPIGGNSLTISDQIENIGAREESIGLLYHTNFGFPIIGHGTTVRLNDKDIVGPISMAQSTSEPTVTCFRSNSTDAMHCVLRREQDGQWSGLKVKLSWDAAALPYVQVWKDLRPYTNIIAIEPTTSERTHEGGSSVGPSLPPGGVLQAGFQAEFIGA